MLPKSRIRRLLPALLAAAAAACSLAAGAQQVYRIVGPDGRVTFSDRPPPEGAAGAAPAPTVAIRNGGGSAIASLPFELRQVAQRFPVTLYTGNECAPCAAGRNYLASRGIPFAEKTVATADDVAALKRLSGEARLPFLTIGGQQINGFSETEWGQFLDAAGYPRSSRLPAGWRNPAAEPLVAVQRVPEAPAAPEPAARPQRAQAPVVPAEPPANPAGIRF